MLGGDGRAVSPGHSAKFGSYTTMDLQKRVVIDIQLVQAHVCTCIIANGAMCISYIILHC